MKVAWLLVLVGCLGRPVPHGQPSDGGGDPLDGAPDGPTPIPCLWQAPVALPDFGTLPSDALTSPWLSDDRHVLYFTRRANNNPLAGSIMRAQFANTWGSATPYFSDSTTSYDNAHVDTGMELWFDQRPRDGSAPAVIADYEPGSGFTTLHGEVGGHQQPAVAADGSTIYFTSVAAGIVRGSVAGQPTMLTLSTGPTLTDPPGVVFDSPSVSPNGSTLYVTGRSATNPRLYEATLTSAHDAYASYAIVEPFQLPGRDYFDPSISADGKTLAYASSDGMSPSRLFYVTRDCIP